jgi:hypothetical protein
VFKDGMVMELGDMEEREGSEREREREREEGGEKKGEENRKGERKQKEFYNFIDSSLTHIILCFLIKNRQRL